MNDQMNQGFYPKHPYSLPDPYPTPKVLGENHYYASILLEDYAGISGELTAIHQYIYHSLTSEDHTKIATLTQQIAIVEMHHLKLLGKTIQLLGEYPIMYSNDHDLIRFWNAKFVYYGHTVYDKLSANMKHEMDAIQNYRRHQRLIDDPFIQELLERIILDEEHHLQLFKTCRDEFCNTFHE